MTARDGSVVAAGVLPGADAEAISGRIFADYCRFLERWSAWVEAAEDVGEATRRMKAGSDAARAALTHLEHFRKAVAMLGLDRQAAGPRSLEEWRALMPLEMEEERGGHDEHDTA